MADILTDLVERQELMTEAAQRYASTESYQGRLKSKYTRLHHFYAPLNGDQWPEDLATRPGKLHITSNIIKAAVDVDSRLQSLLPRISLPSDRTDDDTRKKTEAAEKVVQRWLEASGWDVWMNDLCRVKCLYGKGVLKPIWVKDDKRPDVSIVENPANLRIGWGSSDFTVKDWALYEYELSPMEAMSRWPSLQITNEKKGPDNRLTVRASSNHTDPLEQMIPMASGVNTSGQSKVLSRPIPYVPTDYENKHVRVWDYWYKHSGTEGIEAGTICNAVFVEGVLADGPTPHPEYPAIPYIVIENDHEAGSPEGISTAEPLIDLQIEMNRALSHWAQLVADEIDPAWQLTGENADSVPPGTVPRGGEIVAAGGGNEIKPIEKAVNQFPIQQLLEEYWNQFHRVSGLSEVLFGQTPSSEMSGRALAVQVEAAANRLDPKRRRLYEGLRQLLVFWTYMAEKVNPTFDVPAEDGPGTQKVGLRDVVGGYRRWRIIPPEITPRDVIENTSNVINKVNAKIVSLKTGMDELGVDAPEDEIDLIRLERSDPHLFPGDVNAYVAVVAALSQVQQQLQAMQQSVEQLQAGANGQLGVQNQQAQPAGVQGDNGESPTQPSTPAGPGGTPPAGANGPIAGTTLVRATPTGGAQTLNQLALTQRY